MLTLPAAAILLSGLFNGVSHASAVKRQDAPLQQYQTQVTQLLEQASRGIQCYKAYVPKVQASSPPQAAVLSSLNECDASYDAVSLHLRDARNTARQPNFPSDQLFGNKLPDVLDGRETQQGEYTQNLQTQLDQLRDSAAAAVAAYDAGQAAATRVAQELKKQAQDRQIDVSNAKVESQRGSNGVVTGIIVTGAVIAGVPIVGGVVTYAPFVTAATDVASSLDILNQAVTEASTTLQEVSNTPVGQLTVNQLGQLRNSVTVATNELVAVGDNIGGMEAQLANVPQAESAEAWGIAQTHNAAFDNAHNTLTEVVDGYTALRDSIINRI